MKKLLSKILSVLLFISIVLPSTSKVFAAGEIDPKINVVNNGGMPDTVKVTGLEVGDTVKVYSVVPQPGTLPGLQLAFPSALPAGLSVEFLTPESRKTLWPPYHSLKVTATDNVLPWENGSAENYLTDPLKKPLVKTVSGIAVGTVTLLGTATAKADKVVKGAASSVSATVSAEFPAVPRSVYADTRKAGSVYVSVTRKGMHESIPTEIEYSAEKRTPKDSVKVETPVNNAGIPDTVKVTGLEVGDIVKVYAAPDAAPEAAPESAAITTAQTEGDLLAQLNAVESRYLYIKNLAGEGTQVGQISSSTFSLNEYTAAFDRLKVICQSLIYSVIPNRVELFYKYIALFEARGNFYQNSDFYGYGIANFNGTLINSTYPTSTYPENKFVKDIPVGLLLGTATAKADKVEKGTTPTISATVSMQLPNTTVDANRVIFVSVTRKSFLESDKIGTSTDMNTLGKSYSLEARTEMPLAPVTIVNNAIIPDIVTVENLKVGDIVKVYQDGIIKGTSTAKANKAVKGSKGSPITATATLSIPQLGKNGGSIKITITSKGLLESLYSQQIDFSKEGQTDSPKVWIKP